MEKWRNPRLDLSVVDAVLPDGDDRPFVVVVVEVAAFAGGEEAVAFASGDGLALLVALTWALSTVFLVPVAAATPSIPWHCFLFGPDCDTTDGESPLVSVVVVAAAAVVSSCSLSGAGRFVPRLAAGDDDADGGSSVETGCDGLVVVDMVR